jgi:hypothetical protein
MQSSQSNLKMSTVFLYYFVAWSVTLLGSLVLLGIYRVTGNPETQSGIFKRIPWFFGYIMLDTLRCIGFARVILRAWSGLVTECKLTRWRVLIACIGLLSPVCLIDLHFEPCFEWIIPLYVCCTTLQSTIVLVSMYAKYMLGKQFYNLEVSVQETIDNIEIITIVYE